MIDLEFDELIEIGKKLLRPRQISRSTHVGSVSAVLLTEDLNIYTEICIDSPCSLGFCAEYGAIGAMVTAGESKIIRMVAIYEDGSIIPPCGRCREFINQLNDDNYKCEVQLQDKVVSLKDLLPESWN